jgi:hypothetical protein
MATTMKVSFRYGSHVPVILQAMRKTTGDVLELGGGVFSTPILHWLCYLDRRLLVTYENYPDWYDFLKVNESSWHKVKFVKSLDDANIDKPWDVALVDCTPDGMRKEMVKKLANNTKYLIIHDSNGRYNNIYHYETIYPLFKYMYTFDKIEPSTTVLSNLIDVTNFL